MTASETKQPGQADAPRAWFRARLNAGWPPLLFALAEGLGLAWVSQYAPPGNLLALVVAASLAGAGLALALLRPGGPSMILACFSLALAGVITFTPAFRGQPGLATPLSAIMITPPLAFRLLNGALLPALALHLAVVLYPRRPVPGWALTLCYLASAGGALLIVLLPPGPARLGAQAALTATILLTLGAMLVLLITASRAPPGGDARLSGQARLVLMGLLLTVGLLVLQPILRLVGIVPPPGLTILGQLLLPVGFAAAVLWDDLFGVDVAVRRALAAGSLSLLLLTLYLGLSGALMAAVVVLDPPRRNAAILAGLLLAAVSFTPIRMRAEAAIERVVYPERPRLREAVAAAQMALAQVVRREAVVALLEHELPRRVEATHAALSLDPAAGAVPDAAWQSDLVVGGRPLGHYTLGPRRTGLPYNPAEQAQLATLARQAALALAYAEAFAALGTLNAELEERVGLRGAQLLAQQRALIVAEERQRIARDLHDSVKQTLFSLGLELRGARLLIKSDPSAAAARIHEHEQTVTRALAEMRALLAQLRTPQPATTDLTLELRAYAAELGQRHGWRVELDLPADLPLPSAVAGELLLIAREALHNAWKHSGAATAHVRLASDHDRLTLSVSDQGRGFVPGEAGAGMGLRGMHERATALGGGTQVVSTPGAGTTVTVCIPVWRDPS